jgi:hypothetical protein
MYDTVSQNIRPQVSQCEDLHIELPLLIHSDCSVLSCNTGYRSFGGTCLHLQGITQYVEENFGYSSSIGSRPLPSQPLYNSSFILPFEAMQSRNRQRRKITFTLWYTGYTCVFFLPIFRRCHFAECVLSNGRMIHEWWTVKDLHRREHTLFYRGTIPEFL